MLISKEHGSFVFLGELIIDLELEYDELGSKDNCGTCTRCLDSCPTGAIVKPYLVDGSKCISYFTIELKESIPESYKKMLKPGGRMFVVTGKAPAMTAHRVTRTSKNKWTTEELFETNIEPMIEPVKHKFIF